MALLDTEWRKIDQVSFLLHWFENHSTELLKPAMWLAVVAGAAST